MMVSGFPRGVSLAFGRSREVSDRRYGSAYLKRIASLLGARKLPKMRAEPQSLTREESRGALHFYTLDAEFRFKAVSRTAVNLWDRTAASLLGKNLWSEFPSGVQSDGYAHHQQAMRDRGIHRYHVFSPRFERWYFFTLCPAPDGGLMCFFRQDEQRPASSALGRTA
jgi:hypothetical protein